MSNIKEVVAPNKAKVTMSKALLNQVRYLHEKCPRNTEWSGLLVWKLEKGSLEDLTDVEITAEAVFPMDYGDSTFTSFEGNADWLTMFSLFPQVNPMTPEPGWYIGKIHSHHNMGVFHSQTDKNDLYENAPKLPMFLSLIVNYKQEYDCELAIAMQVQEVTLQRNTWKLKGWDKSRKKVDKITNNVDKTYIMKCEMYYEVDEVEGWLEEQCKALANKPKPVVYTPPYGNGYAGYNHVNTLKDTKQIVVPPYVLTQIRNNIVDLISLGEMYSDVALKSALNQVDRVTEVANRSKYGKAVKYYFLDSWYDSTFYNMVTNEVEVMEGIIQVLKDQNNWLVTALKDIMNELKEEYPKLWAVQRTPVVR
jgi:hypothetical protein